MSLEEMSFRNLVAWHRDELIKIVNGAHASELFTKTHHSCLVRRGVLRRVPAMRRTLPTPEAMVLLEDQGDNQG